MVNLNFQEILIADLHIHSRFSRACSKDLTIKNLVKWARIKGINLLGTGDFTHPQWLEEIKNQLNERKGFYYYQDEKGEFPFILSSEISLIYKDEKKLRKIHLVYLSPNIETVEKINSWLDKFGRRDYDGRPIFKISCENFVAKMHEINPLIEVIPAHIWTPYFGVFGSGSGFDSLKEAFGNQLKNIHSIETGISSDPEMNWKVKDLENISIISFSDAHSYWPWRLGREATIFKKTDNYQNIIEQIRKNEFIGTIETDPAYGKYHFDGHAKCNFSCSPSESKKLNNTCPKCGQKLTIGVEHRVEDLSKNTSNPKIKKRFYKLLPLHEIISLAIKKGINTKSTWEIYNNLIKNFKTEFEVLLNTPEEKLKKILKNEFLVELIIKNRHGKIEVKPGYDGEYGVALIKNEKKDYSTEKQKKLFN